MPTSRLNSSAVPRLLAPALVALSVVLTAGPVSAQPASTDAVSEAGANAGGVPWSSLRQEQKTALRPLLLLWPSLAPDHQRKWMALAQNFSRMSPDEQRTLQSRMTEWARLTPAQRTQARLNFGEVRRVPADEKRAKWEEYQALPVEERARLASGRPKTPTGAAPALRPAPADKILRRAPSANINNEASGTGAQSLRGPGNINRHTLLPQLPASAPAR